jgi:hypothetical protein
MSGLRELRVRNFKTSGRRTNNLLRSVKFQTIESLWIEETVQAALFIEACPNLIAFEAYFHRSILGSITKALQSTTVQHLTLHNRSYWGASDLDGKRNTLSVECRSDLARRFQNSPPDHHKLQPGRICFWQFRGKLSSTPCY